jgi:Ca-activated chloride channel family protein
MKRAPGAGAVLAGWEVAAVDLAAAAVFMLAVSWGGSGRAWADPPRVQAPTAGEADASSLWVTRAQRAQRLLDTGHPAEAARLFKDPRRKAYAESQAGRYAEAARTLAPLHDPQSQYNRGNALARSGALLGALADYNAALAQTPNDRDVRHNRDLVARVLTSRAQRGGSRSGQGGKPGSRGQSGNEASRGSQGQGAADARSGQSAGSRAGQTGSTGGATAEQEAEQAREDAALAAALKRRGAQQGGRTSPTQPSAQGDQGGTARAGRGTAAQDLPWPPPKSEQALALDQWLRRIPEDPGGLLRRKFLIEHMERQEAQQ